MVEIINSRAFKAAMIELNKFFDKKGYSRMEIAIIIEEYRKALEVFEKLDQGKAVREAIIEFRDLKNDET